MSHNVMRHSHECLATVVRQSRNAELDLKTENFHIFIPYNIVNSFLFDYSKLLIMTPLRRGGGYIVFGVDPVGVGGVGVAFCLHDIS